jgi:hypothetical protein
MPRVPSIGLFPMPDVPPLGLLGMVDVGITVPWNKVFPGDPEIRIPDEYFRGVPTLLSLYIYGISSLLVLISISLSNSVIMLRSPSLPYSSDFISWPSGMAAFDLVVSGSNRYDERWTTQQAFLPPLVE